MIEDQEHFNRTPKPTPLQSHPQRVFSKFSPTPGVSSDMNMTPFKDNSEEKEGVIYGTNIMVSKTLGRIEQFLLNFTVTLQEDDDQITKRLYWEKLQEFKESQLTEGSGFLIEGTHIFKFSQEMYLQLIYFPVQMISLFDQVIQSLYLKKISDSELDTNTNLKKKQVRQNLRVFIVDLMPKDKFKIQDLSPKSIGRLVSISGMPLRMSEIVPEMKSAAFECDYCRNIIQVELINATVDAPKKCQLCKKSDSLILIHNACSFTNKQYIKFQELLHNVGEGQSPVSVQVIAYDSHADMIRCGDSVEIVGIYRCSPVKVERGKMNHYRIFSTYIDLISFKLRTDNRHKIKTSSDEITSQEKATFLKMANKETIVQDLVDSFAPSIFGNKGVKKGVLAQLMGGTNKDRGNTNNRCRSNINVLLIGDPSTAKSQMLQHLHRIALRSIYTCGRGSSASGLTATVTKDPETKEFILESGALVLGDLGICCIDEFDKMGENARQVLLESMQQQTISIAKAGIVCQLNSRTAILAAANPIDSKYNIRKSVIENIDLPPPLLTRFDLIFIMLDCPSEEEDRKVAAHLLDFYSGKAQVTKTKYSMEILSKYISFAKELRPLLNEAAGERLIQEYTHRRKIGLSNKSISTNPRMLESLIRISQAFAKMRLSNQATVEDVEQAIELMNEATLKSATDPETGTIDMDIIMTGRTSSMKKKAEQISYKIKELLFANQQKYSTATSIDLLQEHLKKIYPKDHFEKVFILEALQLLKTLDIIYLFGQNKENPKFKLQQWDEQ